MEDGAELKRMPRIKERMARMILNNTRDLVLDILSFILAILSDSASCNLYRPLQSRRTARQLDLAGVGRLYSNGRMWGQFREGR
jgi:hypothetical protein